MKISEEEKKLFINKRIKSIDVTGYFVEIITEDNTELFYDATDGGYSRYEIVQNYKEYKEEELADEH